MRVNPDKRATIARILRWVISATLLVLLFRTVDLQALWMTLENTNLFLVFAAFLMLSVDRVFYGIRWKMILQPYAPWVSTLTLVRITYISTFMSNFLPSALSADLVRGYFLHKERARLEEVVSSVMLDRAVGFVSQLFLALIALAGAYVQGFLPRDWLFIVFPLIALTILGVGVVATPWFGSLVNRLQSSRWGILQKVSRMVKAVREYPWTISRIVKVFGFTCLAYVFAIYASYLLFLSIGGELPFSYFFLFVLIVQLAIMIPISIGGFGVHEGAWVVVMGTVGIPASEAFGFALLLHTVGLLVSLPGGIMYAIHRPQLASLQEKQPKASGVDIPEAKEEVLDVS